MSADPDSSGDGEVVRRVVLDTPSCRVLRDVASYQRDFRLARTYIDFYLEADIEGDDRSPAPIDALWYSAVISYSRAFQTGVRRTERPLNSIYDATQSASHDYFIGLRNRYLVHSVNGFEEVVIAAGLTAPDDPSITEIQVRMTSVSRMTRQHAGVLRALCDLQLRALSAHENELHVTVAREAQELGADAVYALPPLSAAQIDHTQVMKSRFTGR